ncbi:two-component system alkaline phosphatase synthesis response regulator PhoP/two-component system response regulator ResD [Thermosporothrix hazakensis]|jgi:DNA-binding response OmpR family regulator|uniref:Two-component system alkaline phosphatase synthesis response regulator PhoP/two-component system response regulator ResD n=2 Tax=Thermosporothrix TaxID=768650 RepID=A0A326U1W9_THEHA|nr:response regulator transcription factor [Thermosporothrix hazakensis]PZW24230.1 two-component system alkaline phosphatase synthesis response regulator PhoP/two-component system response regulator ResD [Thermosporothrix hazakensis]BBH89676.1 DNA-binding response regulator [Thermosporothrix sp. COM3]GCE47862.1 DNA-binding response regulator [Thermosporothrix hazakensis]
MARVLVVEDEVDICNLIKSELEAEGHVVFQAFDGPTALTLVEQHIPHLIILDWMLPGLDGLSVCRRVRQNHLMPIIMLTARNEEIDRILGLEVGADDYVSKPFSVRELMARVRAMLRRVELDSRLTQPPQPTAPAQPAPSEPAPTIVHGTLMINQSARTVQLNGSTIDLTPREYELLVLLTSHPGRAFSRDFLLQQLWGYDYDGFDRTVDTHITRLRKKLGPLGEKIATVWGVGYRFTA